MKNTGKIKYTAVMSMMLALITVLSALEHMIPPFPFMPPHVKIGLSNIVTMYTLFFLGKKEAFVLAGLKSSFIFVTRGFIAGLLSLGGGICSLLVILLAAVIFKSRISYTLLSITGALTHNLAQLVIVSLINQTNIWFYYLPVLTVSAVFMGSVTGYLLKVVMPAFDAVFEKNKKNISDSRKND